MSSTVQAMLIPAILIGVSCYQLKGHLSAFSYFFFAAPLADQACFLTLLFALLFGSLSLSLSLLEYDDNNNNNNKSNNTNTTTTIATTTKDVAMTNTTTTISRRNYPLAELQAASKDLDRFKCVYPMIREELLTMMKETNEMNQEALEWCKEVMDYNVPGGKLNRGTTVLSVLRTLVCSSDDKDKQELTPLETARAAVLGWSLEFLQAFFLVADDVMDGSKTRRGQPCWYKLDKVGMIAINDGFLLESFVFNILKLHFGHDRKMYADLVDLLLDVIQKTELGQLLDLTSQPAGHADGRIKVDLNRFTLERYNLIVKYKTAFYSFYLPTAMGMILSGMTYPSEAFQTAQRICCIMGEYFQIQDDYLDCYGDPATIGKIGTDIQDNKCSWLVVQALDRANPKQRKILESNYGQWNDTKVKTVKALYKELELEKLFMEYEEASYAAIQTEMDSVSHIMPKDVFEVLLKKIYKRSK